MIKSVKQIEIFKITEDEKKALATVRNLFREMTSMTEYIVDGDGRSVCEVFDDAFGDVDEMETLIGVLDTFLEAEYLEEDQ